MHFNKEALGDGLTVFSNVENGKAIIELTAYLQEAVSEEPQTGKTETEPSKMVKADDADIEAGYKVVNNLWVEFQISGDSNRDSCRDFPELYGNGENALMSPDGRRKRDLYYYYKACWTKEPEVKRDKICLGNDIEVPVSKKYYAALKERHENKIERLRIKRFPNQVNG